VNSLWRNFSRELEHMRFRIEKKSMDATPRSKSMDATPRSKHWMKLSML